MFRILCLISLLYSVHARSLLALTTDTGTDTGSYTTTQSAPIPSPASPLTVTQLVPGGSGTITNDPNSGISSGTGSSANLNAGTTGTDPLNLNNVPQSPLYVQGYDFTSGSCVRGALVDGVIEFQQNAASGTTCSTTCNQWESCTNPTGRQKCLDSPFAACLNTASGSQCDRQCYISCPSEWVYDAQCYARDLTNPNVAAIIPNQLALPCQAGFITRTFTVDKNTPYNFPCSFENGYKQLDPCQGTFSIQCQNGGVPSCSGSLQVCHCGTLPDHGRFIDGLCNVECSPGYTFNTLSKTCASCSTMPQNAHYTTPNSCVSECNNGFVLNTNNICVPASGCPNPLEQVDECGNCGGIGKINGCCPNDPGHDCTVQWNNVGSCNCDTGLQTQTVQIITLATCWGRCVNDLNYPLDSDPNNPYNTRTVPCTCQKNNPPVDCVEYDERKPCEKDCYREIVHHITTQNQYGGKVCTQNDGFTSREKCTGDLCTAPSLCDNSELIIQKQCYSKEGKDCGSGFLEKICPKDFIVIEEACQLKACNTPPGVCDGNIYINSGPCTHDVFAPQGSCGKQLKVCSTDAALTQQDDCECPTNGGLNSPPPPSNGLKLSPPPPSSGGSMKSPPPGGSLKSPPPTAKSPPPSNVKSPPLRNMPPPPKGSSSNGHIRKAVLVARDVHKSTLMWFLISFIILCLLCCCYPFAGAYRRRKYSSAEEYDPWRKFYI
jgi:hypothetical protein